MFIYVPRHTLTRVPLHGLRTRGEQEGVEDDAPLEDLGKCFFFLYFIYLFVLICSFRFGGPVSRSVGRSVGRSVTNGRTGGRTNRRTDERTNERTNKRTIDGARG